MHVDQCELDLPHGLHAALKILCRQHPVEQTARYNLSSFDMSGHAGEHAPFPAEVLHELGRQLDRVPFDTAYSGDAQIVDSREQMVQSMAEFVKQGHDFVVREQRGLVPDRCGKVADEMRNRSTE